MRIAFLSRDGLMNVSDCPDIDDGAVVAMRPLKPIPPLVNGVRERLPDYRRYERTGWEYLGAPIFEEAQP